MDNLQRGIAAGLFASIPQVLLTQLATRLVGLPNQQAEIGPNFIERLAQRLEKPAPPVLHWFIAAVFHFAYAGGWGSLYGAVQNRRHVPALAGALTLSGLIY